MRAGLFLPVMRVSPSELDHRGVPVGGPASSGALCAC